MENIKYFRSLILRLAIIGISLTFSGCSARQPQPDPKTWGDAAWIGYEQLPDCMKQVPAVHGNGDELGSKCLKRVIVPAFRKEINLPDTPDSACINICGLGHYELYVNGERIGDRFLSPGWTSYSKRCLYNSYDLTSALHKGANALGILVGNGFFNVNRERYRKLVVAYGNPRLIFRLRVYFKDGSTVEYVSGDDCKLSSSAITFSSIYGGEDYDARLEQAGWNMPGFDDRQWKKAVLLTDQVGSLEPEQDYPLKVMQVFPSQKIMKSATGKTVYDFGQNASGIIALKVKGNRGARVTIRPDELLNGEGNITQLSGGGPYEFNYTLKGEGIEEWKPRFSYYGFRYAEVQITEPAGMQAATEILSLTMLHTRNSAPEVGNFGCSDSLFNQTYRLINWGIRSNLASVTTDCPHREKLGWLEQTYLIGPSMQYLYDIRTLYRKIIDDMMDSQLDNGLVPDIAPEYVPFEGGFRDSPEWGSAAVIIPWLVYSWYGDTAALRKAYPMMQRYLAYLQGKAGNHLLDYGLGDWYDLGPNYPGIAQLTPLAVTASSMYYYDLGLLSRAALVLGKEKDATGYLERAKQVKKSFLEKFYTASSGLVATGSQTAYAMALYTGLIPQEDRARVLQNLTDSIAGNDYALSSGDIGYHFLVHTLSDNGRSDILYRMNNRSDRPGYGYQLKKGATALTESWAALPQSSNNHMMLGHLMEWFFAGLGGISQDENSVAYQHIRIAPKPVGTLKWVNCSFRSVKGMIRSDWKIEGRQFLLEVAIPNGSLAKVVLPEHYRSRKCRVSELPSDRQLDIRPEAGVLQLAAGVYRIVAE